MEANPLVIEVVRWFLINAPLALVLIIQLDRLYTDWQKDRKIASDERQQLYGILFEIKARLEIMERAIDERQRVDDTEGKPKNFPKIFPPNPASEN